jgi:hypothetical protein
MLLSTTHACITPCISVVSVTGQRTEFGGLRAEPRPKASTAAITVYGEPDIVRLLPNCLVPYRDRSLKTTRKSYGLESKVHPKIPPIVPFVPWIRGSRA